MNMKIEINKDELYRLYRKQEYSLEEIGKIFDCSHQTIKNNLKKYGIKIRTWKEAKNTNRIKKRYSTMMTGENHPNWKGGITQDSDGYILIWQPNHPRAHIGGYVKRARLVAEKMLGRYLYSEEIAHHKNEIRNDDRPENIEVMESRPKHTKYHWQLKRRKKGEIT